MMVGLAKNNFRVLRDCVDKPAEARLGNGIQQVDVVAALIHHLKVVANAGRLKPALLQALPE
jgi:hypothetical protein